MKKVVECAAGSDLRRLPIGVTDSGVGGLTVLSELEKILPDERFVFVADTSGAPYGPRGNGYIRKRVFTCVQTLRQRGVKAVVLACNTATAVAVERLRACLPLPVIGIEPAIRVAARETDGRIMVFATPATVRQERFKRLVADCGKQRVCVAALPTLASEIEQNFCDGLWLQRCAARLTEQAEGCTAIVLGCTHYVFLRPYFPAEKASGVRVFDGNLGTALHLKQLLAERGLAAEPREKTEALRTEKIYI